MPRSIVVVLFASGCGIESRFVDDVPSWPNSVVPALPDPHQTDVIVQVTTPRVDILWMVDNSCSMANEQELLADNFPYFMNFFLGSGLDYHVGVTSSDIIRDDYPGSSGTLSTVGAIKFIEVDTPDPITVFQQMALLGVGGAYPEKGLGGTYLCLEEKRDTVNAGYYRDEAAIHTIIISDEPDFTDTSLITVDEYIDWYDGLKLEADMRTFSAIIDPNRGTKYAQVSDEIGGITWDLQQENWPGVLEQLGLQAAGMKREYFLSQRPADGTIEVSVQDPGGAELSFAEGADWTYDPARNSITFVEYIPNALAKVIIDYTLLAAVEDAG